MLQMYKVFIKDKRIIFTNNQHDVDKVPFGIALAFFSKDIIPIVLDALSNQKDVKQVLFYVNNVEEVFSEFKTYFTIIEAAGGVVKNNENKTLFIYRLDKWDLPKGKIEKAEKIEGAAIREVEEECAVSGLEIVKPLPNCYHIYHLNEKPILKKTHWFEMKTDFEGDLIPQQEEGIEKVEWFTNEQIQEIALENTYASIADFLEKI